MKINEYIFETMEKKGLKQAQLAEYLKITKSVVTNWKQRGNNPPAEYIVPICEFLNVSVKELLNIDDNSLDDKIIKAYHNADIGTQKSVLKLLDIEEEKSSNLYTTKIG